MASLITVKNYINYPIWILILSNLVTLIIYSSGGLIISRLGLIFLLIYFIYILVLEYRLIRYHCTNCYYWRKTCGFGRGRLSSLFFKQGDTSNFCKANMTWKDMIPDILVSLIPFVIGIILMILKFDFILLTALLLLIILTTIGNGFIRGTLTCRYCKQKELGCPAYALFNKK